MNKVAIKFGTELKPIKQIVVNYNFTDFLMGWSVITKIGFAWKYGRSLREATINVNAIFSILGYLASFPWKA